ncbi:MAG TPA: TetR family transcriptional regulator [Mycobacterium sp.]
MIARREQLLDAAISLLGEKGVRAVTHRAVDAAAGLPVGSTSNHFRTREALFEGIAERFSAREGSNWEELAGRLSPTTPAELAQAASAFAMDATRTNRTLTLARYTLLIESARLPSLRRQLSSTGARVNAWFATWLRVVGSTDVDRDANLIMNYWTGLVLHELAIPDPGFDPGPRLIALLTTLIPAQSRREALFGNAFH